MGHGVTIAGSSIMPAVMAEVGVSNEEVSPGNAPVTQGYQVLGEHLTGHDVIGMNAIGGSAIIDPDDGNAVTGDMICQRFRDIGGVIDQQPIRTQIADRSGQEIGGAELFIGTAHDAKMHMMGGQAIKQTIERPIREIAG